MLSGMLVSFLIGHVSNSLWCFYREAKALFSCQAEHSHELSFPQGALFSNGNHTRCSKLCFVYSCLGYSLSYEPLLYFYKETETRKAMQNVVHSVILLLTLYCYVFVLMSMQCMLQWNLAGSKLHITAKLDSSQRIMWRSTDGARKGKSKVHGIHGVHFCKKGTI